ncbi:MAG: hypothetical protein PHR35_10010 [Kiritimatiellae bacterium]|nr:hypothetical protein [Kiritimatiellia bacterium]
MNWHQKTRCIPAVLMAGMLASFTQAADVVIDGVASNHVGDYYVGNDTAGNTLTIKGGGSLTNANGYVGFGENGDSNVVTVTGAGSAWTNNGVLHVGAGTSPTYGDYNTVFVSNGATLYNSGLALIGAGYFGSKNTVVVDGKGSLWTSVGALQLGTSKYYYTYTNGLVIRNGGKVVSTAKYSGVWGYSTDVSCRNYAIIDGTGSLWRAGAGFGPGGGGGQLTITNGGLLVCSDVYDTADGVQVNATVTGPGSCWSNTPGGNWDGLGIYCKNSRLLVADGGRYYAGSSLRMGWLPSSCGNVYKVTGTGSVIQVADTVTIGNRNTILVENGGCLTAGNLFALGPNDTSNSLSRTEVTGAGSLLSAKVVFLGDTYRTYTYCESNTFLVADGGRLTCQQCTIGPRDNSYYNIGQVHGTGSTFVASTALYLGARGAHNTFRVEDGAQAQALLCEVGADAAYAPTGNTLTVTGIGSVFSNVTLNVGNSSSGVGNGVLIADGGCLMVGDAANVYANAFITNVFKGVSSGLDILKDNDNALTIADGGKVCLVFEKNGQVPDQFYWGLRWRGNHTNALNNLVAADKLVWDVVGLPVDMRNRVGVSCDGTYSYVGFYRATTGTTLLVR